MPRTVMVSRVVAGVLAGGLLAAGCAGSGDQPGPTESATDIASEEPSTSMPTSPAPGPTPWPEPSPPAAMERGDIEGAKAAAEYFLELHPYIFATGDVEAWESMSHPDCQFCEGASGHAQTLAEAGGYSTGGEYVVEGISATRVDDSRVLVEVDALELPSDEFSRDGEVLTSYPGGSTVYEFAVMFEDGSWIVRGVTWEE